MASSKAQNTKAKIVKTAENLLWKQGYDGASLNDVVKKAGVSKGALFHYYPNKQAITQDALEKYASEQIFAPLDKHLGNADSLKIGLFNWLQESYNAFAQWKFKGGCMLGNFALELSDKDEKIREQTKQIFLQWENQMVLYFKPVAAEGKLLMEPRQFARILIAGYQGMMMLSKVHKDQIRGSREFQALAEFIERMIKD